MKTSTATGLAALAGVPAIAAGASGAGRDYYEIRQYTLETEEQRAGLERFFGEALIPALHRIDVGPVGVFSPKDGDGPVYAVLRHRSLESFATRTQRLTADEEFQKRGATFINAPAGQPAYKRLETSLLKAFNGMPEMDRPVTNPGRVFQLRIYESPSVKTGQKKIEMFNEAGEIRIFREVGLRPVFFGENLTGSKMPNLTYMLGFESEDALRANWKKFLSHPDWQRLRVMPEYADKSILSGITNIVLLPADCSEI